jgi:hypothetical protein
MVFAFGCASSSLTHSTGKLDTYETVILDNGLIRAEFMPEMNGRMNSLFDLITRRELFMPYSEVVYAPSPLLPRKVTDNNSGFKFWMWKVPYFPDTRMNLVSVSEAGNSLNLTMSATNYMHSSFGLVQSYTLNAGESKIICIGTFKNNADIPRTLSVWAHSVPKMVYTGKIEELIIPAANSTGTARQQTAMCQIKRTGFLPAGELTSNNFVIPARNWLARVADNKEDILVMRSAREQFEPNGFFYLHHQGGINSQEMILGERKIAPKGQLEVKFELLVFSKMAGVKEVTGDFALDSYVENDTLHLTIGTVKTSSNVKLEVEFIQGESRKKIAAFNIPVVKVGKAVQLQAKLDQCSAPYQIGGKINGQDFVILN